MNIYFNPKDPFLLEMREWSLKNPLTKEDISVEELTSVPGLPVWQGRKHSSDTIQKMKKIDKSYMKTEEYGQKVSLAKKGISNTKLKGRTFSDETKRKISESMMGKKTRLGKKHSEETKKKISESQIKRLSS